MQSKIDTQGLSQNDSNPVHPYTFVCSDETLGKLHQYKLDLIEGKAQAGHNLLAVLKNKELNLMTDDQFIECLVQTKPDMIFAESTVYSAKENWNGREVSLLGDLSCVIPTQAYDNGAWSKPVVHEKPLDVTLIYVPGPLLAFVPGSDKPDWDEVCPDGKINRDAYYKMLERRILPGLLHVNAVALSQGKKILVTTPGIGCGQFSGKFAGVIHAELQTALHRLLSEHGQKLTQIKALWYDNFDKKPYTEQIESIDFLVRPLRNDGLPQLCSPKQYGEDYADCELVSLVAWDHVSKPGNDYWPGARQTDDGVKAAATGTMPALTGIEGVYIKDRMVPKDAPNQDWSTRTNRNTRLKVAGNLHHYSVAKVQNAYDIQEGVLHNSDLNAQDVVNSKQQNVSEIKKEVLHNSDLNDQSLPNSQDKNQQAEIAESPSFFNKYPRVRGLIIGAVVGLIVIGILAILLAIPAINLPILGFVATLSLTPLATGFSLAAIGLGIVGFFAGIGAGIAALNSALSKPTQPLPMSEEQASLLANVQDSTSNILTNMEPNTSKKVEKEPWHNPITDFSIDSASEVESFKQVKNHIQVLTDSFKEDMQQKYSSLLSLRNCYNEHFRTIEHGDNKDSIERGLNALENKAGTYSKEDKLRLDTKSYVAAVRESLKLLETNDSLNQEDGDQISLSI